MLLHDLMATKFFMYTFKITLVKIAVVILSEILEEFIADYPEVTFSIFSGTAEDIIDKLDRGLLDVGVLIKPI